jgi:uncharacterized protein (TIGR02646 family)
VIRIKQPTKAPGVLHFRGKDETRRLCEEFDIDPTAPKRWAFNKRVYAATSVKSALRKTQHDKCAFCESKISHIAYGDVEHFRPKAGYRQQADGPLARPGYYWLAYELANLLFCCAICNRRHKGNYFPPIDGARRAKSHHDDIENERPFFIHPVEEDPQEFLDFNEEYVRAIGGNDRGKATIDALGLNREPIVERRRDALAKLRLLIKFYRHLKSEIAEQPNLEKRTR